MAPRNRMAPREIVGVTLTIFLLLGVIVAGGVGLVLVIQVLLGMLYGAPV
jgi:hypothetical protein